MQRHTRRIPSDIHHLIFPTRGRWLCSSSLGKRLSECSVLSFKCRDVCHAWPFAKGKKVRLDKPPEQKSRSLPAIQVHSQPCVHCPPSARLDLRQQQSWAPDPAQTLQTSTQPPEHTKLSHNRRASPHATACHLCFPQPAIAKSASVVSVTRPEPRHHPHQGNATRPTGTYRHRTLFSDQIYLDGASSPKVAAMFCLRRYAHIPSPSTPHQTQDEY